MRINRVRCRKRKPAKSFSGCSARTRATPTIRVIRYPYPYSTFFSPKIEDSLQAFFETDALQERGACGTLQHAGLPGLQRAEVHPHNARAHQFLYRQMHRIEHPPDLVLLAFGQDDRERVRAEYLHPLGSQSFVVILDARLENHLHAGKDFLTDVIGE